jgi:argininosuccinate lyase
MDKSEKRKLWGGRFTGEADPVFAGFNASFSFDKRLLAADIEASQAHSEALERAGVLTPDEARKIDAGLSRILVRAREEPGYLDGNQSEDVHSFVEAELARAIGETAYKLHTGRSRNDQVATDLRLFLRGEIDSLQEKLRLLQRALVDLAQLNKDAILPGYTHLQRAQPVLFAHYCLAYYEMFKRDRERLVEVRRRVNSLPLGAAALSGAGFPIDRDAVARRLGFESVAANSLDAVADRDFVIEFVAAAALLMMHLSRLAEDLIIYSTSEFGLVELSDAVSTGSSLMPQKRNPDALELIRGKAARIFGHQSALLAMMKGLPLAYNKDMQEDKEALFDTIDSAGGSVEVMAIVLRNIRLNAGRAEESAAAGYLNATDLADYLVRRGLEFRLAHELVGRIVGYALDSGRELAALSLEEFRRFSTLIDQDVFAALSLESSLSTKSSAGGTSPGRVAEALARALEEVSD